MRVPVSFFLIIIALLSSCGKADLAILNEVNLFSPKWQEVSQQYAFVKRNLGMTLRLYDEHLGDMEPKIERASSSRKPELIGLRSRYQEMVRNAQKLKGDYENEYAELKEIVGRFNEWHTRLMRGKLGSDEARADFATFKVSYRKISKQADRLQIELKENVENHNILMESMANLVGDYQSYAIELR